MLLFEPAEWLLISKVSKAIIMTRMLFREELWLAVSQQARQRSAQIADHGPKRQKCSNIQ